MCTCITWENGAFYFGRNLDLEYSFGEQVALTPRNYPFQLRCLGEMNSHYAMIGMATVMMDYPLYAEAVNEKGLAMAGLNFPGSAVYQEPKEGARNVTPFELIPWLLGTCATVREALRPDRESAVFGAGSSGAAALDAGRSETMRGSGSRQRRASDLSESLWGIDQQSALPLSSDEHAELSESDGRIA